MQQVAGTALHPIGSASPTKPIQRIAARTLLEIHGTGAYQTEEEHNVMQLAALLLEARQVSALES